MANEIITTLHPQNDENTNLYPNIKKENVPDKAIDLSKLDDDVKAKINDLYETIDDLGTLSPSGVDTSTNILAKSSADGIWIGSDTGHWYYWNETQYVDGGVYQATEVNDGEISPDKLQFIDLGVNYFDTKNDITPYKYYDSNRVEHNDDYSAYTKPIYLDDGDYSFLYGTGIGNNAKYVFSSTSSGVLTDTNVGTINGSCINITLSKGYYVFNLQLSTFFDFMIVKGTYSSLPTYEEYKHILNSVKYNGNYILDNTIDVNKNDYLEKINYFNCGDENNVDGKYIESNMSISSANGYSYSYPIYLKKGQYSYPYQSGYGSLILSFFKSLSDGTLIRKINGSSNGNIMVKINIYEDGYYVFNYQTSQRQKFMIIKGHYDTLPNFVAYGIKKLDKFYNILTGKKIGLDGDSICYGEGSKGGYGYIIANKENMLYENIAVGGATIATNTQSSHNICNSLANLSSDCDYIILEGGVNDTAQNVPLGTITEGYGYTFNTDTFIGAMEKLCYTLINNFKGKKYGFVIVHNMVNGYCNTDNPETSYYYNQIKVLKKWGIPFIDLNDKVPAFGRFWGVESLNLLRTTYTKDGDGWHPNKLGYEKYYVDKITKWLKSL